MNPTDPFTVIIIKENTEITFSVAISDTITINDSAKYGFYDCVGFQLFYCCDYLMLFIFCFSIFSRFWNIINIGII